MGYAPGMAKKPSSIRIGRRYRHNRLQGPYDVLVVGSGIGGLTAAACLSKMGKKVCVLEQHYTAGGFTHSYDRNGYEWDVGVHYIGDMGHEKTLGRRLFDYPRGFKAHPHKEDQNANADGDRNIFPVRFRVPAPGPEDGEENKTADGAGVIAIDPYHHGQPDGKRENVGHDCGGIFLLFIGSQFYLLAFAHGASL